LIEGWNWKEELIKQKDKKTIKRIRIKIKNKYKNKILSEGWNWKEKPIQKGSKNN